MATKKVINVKSVLTGCEVPRTVLNPTMEAINFWLDIMQEHAMFIKMGLPCSEKKLIKEAEEFINIFAQLLDRGQERKGKPAFSDFLEEVLKAVEDFLEFKLRLLHLVITCKLMTHNFPLQLDHLSREAEYFIRLLETIKENTKESVNTLTTETVFWHRIMAEHSAFIRHLLDPSEQSLINFAQEFSEEFDHLYHQAKDLQSMLRNFQAVGVFDRFVDESTAKVEKLRDFKLTAEELIRDCKLLGLIPAALAHHLAKEAEYFLHILREIDNLT